MPIALKCGCGKKFSVGDEQPGTKVRCPVCADLVDIPNRTEKAAEYDIAPCRKCPHCKREWPGEPVVCIDCGWNFQSGKRMKTLHAVKTEEINLGGFRTAVFMRNQRGKVTLTLTDRYFFFKRAKTYRLSDYNSIFTDFNVSEDDGPELYRVEIEGPRAGSLTVYTGSSEAVMREVIETLDAWGQFEIKRR